jgi:O-antigen/teichoic acid export membrane protein
MGVIQRQGLQSAIITYLGMLVGFASLLVVQPWLLSPEEIGLTRILYSFSFLISTVLPLSAGNITTKFFPKFRDASSKHKGFLGFMLLFPLLGCLIVLPILYFFKSEVMARYALESPLFVEYFFWIFPLSVVLTLISLMNNYLFAVFRPLLPALAQEVLIRVFFIVLIIVYASGWINLDSFIACFFGTYLLQLFLILGQTVRIGAWSLSFDKSLMSKPLLKEMLVYGATVFGAGIASMAIKLLDAVVLGQYVPLAMVGIYGVAAFIPTFIEAPVTALDKVANPRVSHAWEKGDMENIQEIYYKSSRYLFVLGGFLFLMVVLNAKFLFKWLPPEFYAGVPVVQILSLAALFNLMTGSNTSIIFNSSRFMIGAMALIGVAILNLVLLFVLIPPYGLLGAAWATCLSALAYNLFKYLFILIKFKLQPFDRRTVYIALSILLSLGAASALPLFGNVFLDVASHAFVGGIVYTILIWYSRAVEDLSDLLPFFKKKL